MEVWILLAAAGSGYLAKRLQNSHNSKGSSEDEDEDNKFNPKFSTSNRKLSYQRGVSHHFSSSSVRRKGLKPRCGKELPSGLSARKHHKDEKKEGKKSSDEEVDMIDRRRKKIIDREMEMLDKEHQKIIDRGIDMLDRDQEEIVDIKMHMLVKNPENKVFQRCLEEKNFKNASKEKFVELDPLKGVEEKKFIDINQQVSMMRLSRSCDSMIVGSIDDTFGQGKDAETKLHVSSSEPKLNIVKDDSSSPSSIGLLCRKGVNDDDKMPRTRYTDGDGYTGKHIKDGLDIATFQAEEFVFGKTWMPGFWDVTEGVFVLDTESLLVPHDSEGRNKGSSSSRRSRTPCKYGRRKLLKKKISGIQKPMSSLESCLSAQMDEYNRKNRKFEEFRRVSSSYQSSEKELEENSSMGLSTNEVKVELSEGDVAIGLPFLPPRQQHPKKVNTEACENFKKGDPPHSSKHESTYTEGLAGSSFGGILFNFGVGVGIMFAIMSDMQRTRRLDLLLKEAQSLTKDLENELKITGLQKTSVYSRERDDVATTEEKGENSMTNSFINVRSVANLLDKMKMFLSSEAQTIHTKDISKLEAELVAELEIMELDWDGDGSKSARKDSRSSELDREVGSLVQGELRISGLPCELKEDSQDKSASSNEDLHANSYAVSPRDLARRLHEVLETRQEARISELEAEIKLLRMKLHTKEREIKLLRNEADLDCNDNAYKHADNSDLESSSSFKSDDIETKNNTAYITLGGEALAAYMEACNEFTKASNDHPIRSDKDELATERDACERDLDSMYTENYEGLEHVDLVSLAEDLYVNGDPMYMEKMPTNGQQFARTKISRKRSAFRHPQPEHLISSSRGFDSDDATNETSGSTPCSVKCMDFTTNKEEYYNANRAEEFMNCVGINSPKIQEPHSIHCKHNEENCGDFGHPEGDKEWRTINEQDYYYPDLDEQLGELLIKQIVEKSRKGSHIVRDARLMLASLEDGDGNSLSE